MKRNRASVRSVLEAIFATPRRREVKLVQARARMSE